MHKFIPLLLLSFVFNVCLAQTNHTVKAIVMDSTARQPLELVTVALLNTKDSSLISYTLTDKNGAFTLRNVRDNATQRLLISYVGYQSLRISLKFDKAELLNLGNLYLNSKILNEVVIKGERVPIIIKKDTIEFNAEAFKVRPNAVVEDLLKKLPGVQVDHDGTINVNGKDISKIKIDGKDFFAGDPKIASRNLDADMISKVQVYDDRENDPDHLVPDYKVKKIINLKFKKELKKSTFGKVYGGGGTRDRYQTGGLYNRFLNDLQLSGIANSNNLSGTGINLEGQPAFGASGSTVRSTTGGLNFNNSFGKDVKVNLTYNFTNTLTDNNANTNRQQFLNDTVLTGNTTSINHSVYNAQAIYGTLDWSVDKVSKIKYAPRFTYNFGDANSGSLGFSYNNFTPLLNTSKNSSNSNNNGKNYQHNLSYYRTLRKKGESLNITNDIATYNNKSLTYSANDLVSYTAGLNSDTLRRLADNTGKNTSASLAVAYRYPLSKTFTAGLNFSSNYSQNGTNLFTYNQDLKTGLYNIFLESQSSTLNRNQYQESLKPEITYRTTRINLVASLTTQLLQVDNHFNNTLADLNRHDIYLLPSVNFGIDKVSFNYNADVQQPGINDLQPVTIVYNQLNSFTGNPYLKPTRRHNFSVNYFNYNMQSMVNSFLSLSVILESNSITRQRIVSAQGAELTTPINRNGRFTTYIYGSIGKRYKKQSKWQIREKTDFNGGMGHNFFEVNHQEGYQNTFYIKFAQELAINWNDVVDISPAYTVSPSLTKYQLVDYNSVSYVVQNVTVPVDIRWPKHINWNINYAYTYNPLVATGFQRKSNLMSLSVARALQLKDKGELRLTCYDIFNQSISAYHYATENTVNDIQNQSLRRYFLLTYTYKFNKTITK